MSEVIIAHCKLKFSVYNQWTILLLSSLEPGYYELWMDYTECGLGSSILFNADVNWSAAGAGRMDEVWKKV